MKTCKSLIFYILVTSIFIWSCTGNEENGKSTSPTKNTGNKTTKRHYKFDNYTQDEVLVIIDTSLWSKETGKIIKKTFASTMYGLPQPEADYDLTKIGGDNFRGILKEFMNIIFVVDLQSKSSSDRYMKSLLGDENIKKIKERKENYLLQQDIYFEGQNLIYVVGDGLKDLNACLKQNKNTFKYFFDRNVSDYLIARQLSAGMNDAINKSAKEKFGISWELPEEYKIAKSDKDFLWVRSFGMEIDKSFFLNVRDYVDENQFADQYIQKWRDSLGQLIRSEEDTIFVETQKYMPLRCEVETGTKNYTKSCSGLWKLNDNSMGGPFVSKVFLNKERTKIFYMEGFVIAPGKKKRKVVREMNALLSNS